MSSTTAENPRDVFRIVLLGDSFMEAYSTNLEESFRPTSRTPGPARAGAEIEVINLGVGGYGSLQEYLAFDLVGRDYRPDLDPAGILSGQRCDEQQPWSSSPWRGAAR